jgi:hypothetical protein
MDISRQSIRFLSMIVQCWSDAYDGRPFAPLPLSPRDPRSSLLVNFPHPDPGTIGRARKQTAYLRFCATHLVQLGRCHAARLGSFGFAAFRFALFVPAAKFESDGRAGGAQFVRKSAVDHGTSHDHAADG